MIGVMPDTGGRGTGNEILTGEGTGREMRKSCSMLARDEPCYWRAGCGESRLSGSVRGGRKRVVSDTVWGTECTGQSVNERYLVGHLLY